jgi:hypothetical protein
MVVHLAEIQGLTASFPTYVYSGVEEGFAEHDLEQYDSIAADLAWSRSLSAARKGFKQDHNLDDVHDSMTYLTLKQNDASNALGTMGKEPHVNYVPTGTGGIGRRALFHFYKDFFVPGSPPSLQIRLISRTSGVDRVVNEILVSFKHTKEIPWMLPGVPPTNKFVQIPIVSIVAFRGGKLVQERIYWDQASVLLQIGALDPKYVPKAMSSRGCKKLPMMGAEAAKKVVNVTSVPSNNLISKW